MFSDEINGRTMLAFMALRAKLYAFSFKGEEKIKAKGILGHVKIISHSIINTAFSERKVFIHIEKTTIKSFNHKINTIKSNKLNYNNRDNKWYVLEDHIPSLAHKHSMFFF